MIKNSVVFYKSTAALVGETEGDKFSVQWCANRGTPGGKKPVYANQKVREKDVLLLSEKPASSIDALLTFADKALSLECQEGKELASQIAETHELLLSDEESAGQALAFGDLAELVRGELKADESWALYSAFKNSFEFKEEVKDGSPFFIPRSTQEIEALKAKAFEKEHAEELRAAFIERLKERKLNLPEDAKFMGEVEAVALGKTDKSRVMQDIGMKELPEKAHKLLLDTGVWDITRNPYPVRFDLSMTSASESLPRPPEEERFEVPGIAYAIDSEHSTDPDDAIAFDGEYLWVHIADPASTIMPDDSIDKTARSRGATLYLPEGASRMLSEDCLEDYALGLSEKSRALSFKIKLSDSGDVESCEVLKTLVTVKRLTYVGADTMKDDPALAPLFAIAERNAKRREGAGAVQITLPEVHISVDSESKKVSIEPYQHTESGEVVREAMVLAGEGAARFAFKNSIPFPFISQEAPEIPKDIPEGFAGQFRLRKCMRKRNVSVTPSAHAGLGVGMYSQVTSPLRRYGDLIAHEQLRAFLDGRELIDKDEMLMRIAAGDAASIASRQAERKSNQHWTLVYLLQNPEWTGEAVCVDKQPKGNVFLIPSLAMETVVPATDEVELNGCITLKPGKIDLPNLEVVFTRI